jgi:hypothetical protein
MKLFSIIIICLLITACDGGLAPPQFQATVGFSGTVYFAPGTWPPADSITRLLIFASQVYPLDSAKVTNGLLSIPPKIFLYPSMNSSLPFFVDSISYSFPVNSGTYKYLGVVQQVHSDLNTYGVKAFKVVGFYKDSIDHSQPGNIIVSDNSQVQGINIEVDFHNPPPQPF